MIFIKYFYNVLGLTSNFRLQLVCLSDQRQDHRPLQNCS